MPPPSTGGGVQGEEDVPFIPINQYRQVLEPLQQPRDREWENMADQVSNVFPHLPRHVILRDLSESPSAIHYFMRVYACARVPIPISTGTTQSVHVTIPIPISIGTPRVCM